MDRNIENEEIEIDLLEIFQIIKEKIFLIIFVTFIMASLFGVGTHFLIEKKYASTARIFPKPEINEGLFDSTQISSNNMMTNNYVGLLGGNNIHSQVAKQLGLDIVDVKKSLSITNQTNTQIISITSTTTDPYLSKEIVDTTVAVFTKVIKETLEISNITTVDEAQVSLNPVSPNLRNNILIGGAFGAFATIGILVVYHILDNRIKSKEDAEKYLGIPNLGVIPYFEDK